MQPPEIETAAPTGIGNGGYSKGTITTGIYPTFSLSAMDFASAVIADRCYLPAPTARLVVELAHLGGQGA